jgi:Amt family ammonium transporter
MSQLIGTVGGAAFGLVVGLVIYGVLKAVMGIRLTPEEERRGADLSIHRIGANPEGDVR